MKHGHKKVPCEKTKRRSGRERGNDEQEEFYRQDKRRRNG